MQQQFPNDTLRRFAQIESNLNPYAKNPNSSAKGLLQFIDSTANQYGITAEFGTPEYTAQELDAGQRLLDDNARALQGALGREPTGAELYLAHQQGAGGASKLLANPSARAVDVLGRDQVLLNGGNENMTAQEFASQWINKFNSTEALAGGQGQDALQSFSSAQPASATDTSGDDLSIRRQRAIAIARARKRKAEAEASNAPATPEAPEEEVGFIDKVGSLGRNLVTRSMLGGSFTGEVLGVPATLLSTGARPVVAAGNALGLTDVEGYPAGNPLAQIKEDYFSNVENIEGQLDKDAELSPTTAIAGDIIGDTRNILKAGGLLAKGAPKTTAGIVNFLRGGNATTKVGKAAEFTGRSAASAGLSQGGYSLNQAGQADFGNKLDAAGEVDPLALGIGAVVPAGGAIVNKLTTSAKPVLSDAADEVIRLAKKHNVIIGADDVTDDVFYKTLIEEGKNAQFSGAAKYTEKQQKSFNRAVAKTLGLETDSITPKVLNKFYDDIGKEFDGFTQGKTFQASDDAIEQLQFAAQNVENFGENGAKVFNKTAEQFAKLIDDQGIINGDRLEKFRKRMARAKNVGNNQEAKDVFQFFEDLTIDAISESDPAVSQAFRDMKYRYKNFKVIAPLAIKDQLGGNISPAQLKNRVKTIYGENQTAIGNAGDLGELATLGEALKQTVGNSGTAQRQAVQGLTGQSNNVLQPIVSSLNPMLAVNRGRIARNFDQDYIEKLLLQDAKQNAGILAAPVTTGQGTSIIGGR